MKNAVLIIAIISALSSVSAGEDNGDDHGNSQETATGVNFPSKSKGRLEYNGDEDVFSFVCGAGKRAIIYTLKKTDTYIYLEDSDGNVLAEDDNSGKGNNARIEYNNTTTRTLYVRVAGGTSETTGSYKLRIKKKKGGGSLITDSIGMELRRIPAGSFLMGSNSSEAASEEKPAHEVTITRSFYIGVFEVTQKQYRTIMGSNPSRFSGKNRPVEMVSRNDAVKFCRRLSAREGVTYRLPTEAEWEYAARAGTTTEYYWGNSFDGRYAWYEDNSGGQTHSVGLKRPNAWGLYDMAGNVYEWCSDWFGEDYYSRSPSVDPQGPSSGEYRIFRSASFYNSPRNMRVFSRGAGTPGTITPGWGFRCIREL